MTHAPHVGSPRWTGADSGLVRVALHLLLAALPLLAISAHVFGLVRMQLSAALLVVPLATALIALTVFAPHAGDRVLAHGMFWGIVGCAIYDVFRLDTVYMLHWWADFIPTMGTWITGDDANLVSGAIVGYLWRYIGDGGGIGITFFALASAVGLHQCSRTVVVGASVAFSVFPVWAGLIGTVALASRGQTMMFPLTPTTITLSLIGHLIFGLIMGLGFWHSRSVQEHWPWAPVTGSQPRVLMPSGAMAALPAGVPGTSSPDSRSTGSHAASPMASYAAASHAAASSPAAAQPVGAPEAGPAPGLPSSGPLPSMPVVTAADRAATGTGATPTHPPAGSTVPPPPSAPAPFASTPFASTPAAPTPFASVEPTPAGDVPSMPRPRDRGTPPRGVDRPDADDEAAHTLDPHTFQLWQRQMDTTVRGRRTHRARR